MCASSNVVNVLVGRLLLGEEYFTGGQLLLQQLLGELELLHIGQVDDDQLLQVSVYSGQK